MADQEYVNLSYKLKFRRACKCALIVLILCLVVIAPALWFWEQSVTKRQTLREAKNVVLNMNLLAMEAMGYSGGFLDPERPSGLTEDAEAQVRDYAGADGEFCLISWNTGKNCVTTMNYKKGRWLIRYTCDPYEDQETWDIYWNIQQYYD